MIRGTSAQLIANVQPWTATDRDVTWTSADETIATVNKNGVVTGLTEGTTTIRATSNLDPDFYAECVVNVEILEMTIHGTLSDADGNSMFYDWDMSQEDGWTAGAALDKAMTSATYSDAEKVFYMMDNEPSKWMMHKVDAEGNILESADNTNSIAFWDMTYNPYFSEVHGEEQISSIYYYYLLSPKNPMNMNAVGFNLGDLADYLVGITSKGYAEMYDEDGNRYDTEHLVLLDNDGYVWDFWIYDEPTTGGMNALYNISKSNLTCEFPGDDTMDNLYTSLMVGEDGNLYLSTFTGSTNEIWHLSYDADIGQYVAVKLGDVGDNVWPATITSVTMNGSAAANTDSPEPAFTMAAGEITTAELQAASANTRFTVSQAELDHKLTVNDAGDTKTDTIALSEGENQMDISKMVYYSYTADEDGTVSMTVSTSTGKWYAMYYPDGASGSYTSLDSTQPEAVEVTAGSQVILGIRVYDSSKWSAVAGTLTIDVAFTPAGSEPDPTDPTDPTDPEEPEEPENTLVLGTNTLVSGTAYTYTATEEGRLEFDFVITDADGKTIYQYAYSKGTRVKIFINDIYVPNVENTKVSVSAGDTVTVELTSVDGGTYNATLTMTALEPAAKLVIGDNNIARKTDYSFIADRDGTLYTTIKELWCDDAYCSETSLSSSVVFKINGTTVYSFQNAYEVKAGDEITVLMGTSISGVTANAVLNLSWEGFYQHPIGSRGNPHILTYAQCPTTTVEIGAGEAVWYKLTGFGSGYKLIVKGSGAYVIISGTRYDVPANGLMMPAVSSLQIGNSGSAPAVFELSAVIEEGYPDNPKGLTEGENTVTLDESDNYYYGFTAETDGTATFTVSGDNWRFFYSLLAADGAYIVQDEDHQAKRGDADTITVDMTAGQSIVLKLGTLNSSWIAPGGEITVDFHFESEQPAEPVEPENPLVLGKNDLQSGVEYGYVVPADGRMEFSVGSVYNSAGSKQYSWYNGSKLRNRR